MNRNLVMSGVVAAAVHAGVLFGIPGGPAPQPAATRDVISWCGFPMPVVLDDPVAVAEGESAAKGEPRPEPLRSDELLVKDPGPIAIPFDGQLRRTLIGKAELPTVPVGLPDGIGMGAGEIFGGLDLDDPPRTRVQVRPNYPRDAMNDGRRGEVLVEFVVDEAGRVLAPRVVRSSDRIFEEPTLRAVAKWRFEPGRRHGQIVRFRMAVPVVFSLSE